MSASEKLKALDAKFVGNDVEWAEALRDVRAALPQIAAVIAAAEELPEFFMTTDGRTRSFVPLLDALEEALTEQWPKYEC